MAPILHTLGVFNGLAPPYASAILVELLDTNGLHVKISYRNDSSQAPYPLTIPGCDHLCPLEKFKGYEFMLSSYPIVFLCSSDTEDYSW